MARKRLLISGKVQGVGYRYRSHQEATRLGLAGWVRNLRSGQVEALAEGPDDQVAAFVRWCERGPGWASVSCVEVSDDPGDEPLGPFDIRPSA